MENNPQNQTVESLYVQHQAFLSRYGREAFFPKFSREDADDVVQNLFTRLQRLSQERGGDSALPSILGDCSLAALKRHVIREGIAFLRKREAAKRGGKTDIVSLEGLSEETGFECEGALSGVAGAHGCPDWVVRVIAAVEGDLSERERIILRILRHYLPYEVSCVEILGELTGIERLRFLPARGACREDEVEQWILRAISRNKSSLHRKLREARDLESEAEVLGK